MGWEKIYDKVLDFFWGLAIFLWVGVGFSIIALLAIKYDLI